MTITLQAVNELIASLESAGELSIREQKFLKLAKAYQQLAAENVAIREQSEEVYAAGYNHGHLNTVDGIAYAGCVKDDFYSLALQLMAEVETPATDRIVAEAEARGVEKAIAHLEKKFSNIGVQIMNLQWLADSLREGAGK
ncbi:TPA: hypothetical protein MCG72_000696 [Klebsiella pneumoniae]|nr:hypothetical protein [Klebsiella pneumoniae]HBT7050122.1 hypothetical protein [Klebsiella pneumoniae]